VKALYKELLEIHHRPFPFPDGKWFMIQDWLHLLFLHWPVSTEAFEKHIPAELSIDTYESSGWITVIPFKVDNLHFRALPPFPFISSYLELNVRTYVTYNGIPGIYFFSLDASDLLDVIGARTFFSLPYRKADMSFSTDETDQAFIFKSHYSKLNETFKGTYNPISEFYTVTEGTLSHWLSERYCLYTERNGKLFRGDIHHTKWTLQEAVAEIHTNTLASFLPGTLERDPIVHYSPFKRVFFWPLKRVN
jgi:uncharacterized protein YqjF (DUF2071 family)